MWIKCTVSSGNSIDIFRVSINNDAILFNHSSYWHGKEICMMCYLCMDNWYIIFIVEWNLKLPTLRFMRVFLWCVIVSNVMVTWRNISPSIHLGQGFRMLDYVCMMKVTMLVISWADNQGQASLFGGYFFHVPVFI